MKDKLVPGQIVIDDQEHEYMVEKVCNNHAYLISEGEKKIVRYEDMEGWEVKFNSK